MLSAYVWFDRLDPESRRGMSRPSCQRDVTGTSGPRACSPDWLISETNGLARPRWWEATAIVGSTPTKRAAETIRSSEVDRTTTTPLVDLTGQIRRLLPDTFPRKEMFRAPNVTVTQGLAPKADLGSWWRFGSDGLNRAEVQDASRSATETMLPGTSPSALRA